MRNIENRKYVVAFIIVLVSAIFIARLFYMQILDDQWKLRAAEISENRMTTYPARGIVYDRNKDKLISNEVYYDIQIIPDDAEGIDSFGLAKLLDISMKEYVSKLKAARAHSSEKPSELVRQVPPEEFEKIGPELFKYPGVFEVTRTLRMYPKNIAAHVLGYMSEVDSNIIKKMPYYKSGDFIGKTGIERSYEEVLRGQRGVKYLLQNAFGVTTGKFEEGKYDTLAVQGKKITISLDSKLQEYGEKLMKNKLGSIVAIEPKTGEILAMISSPGYDPNLLVGRRLGRNYTSLSQDTLLPLQNRATNSAYPPGSTFKLLMALIGLQEGVITNETSFPCQKSLVGCHSHPTAGDISSAVKMSCNPYFYAVGRRIIQQGKFKSHFRDAAVGMDIWAKYVRSFGIGTDLQVDFPEIRHGHVPNTNYYDNEYPTKSNPYGQYGWAYSTIYSNSIGQGEVLVTPLEMANIAAILANRGYYYYPHFLREIEGAEVPEIYRKKNYTLVEAKHFEQVVDGMWRVVHEPGGTARRAMVDSLNICGKTGTAENFREIRGRRVQFTDHSIFLAFAPKDDPQIAISVYIENAGFGGTWAAPLASLMIEKYITGEIKDTAKENRIINENLIPDWSDIVTKKKK